MAGQMDGVLRGHSSHGPSWPCRYCSCTYLLWMTLCAADSRVRGWWFRPIWASVFMHSSSHVWGVTVLKSLRSVIYEDLSRDCALETLDGRGCICQRTAGVSASARRERLSKCVTWFWELLHPVCLTHWLINTLYTGAAHPIKSLAGMRAGLS